MNEVGASVYFGHISSFSADVFKKLKSSDHKCHKLFAF